MGKADEQDSMKDWTPVRVGFGTFELCRLADNQCVTASGLRDGGYIVWERKVVRGEARKTQ